MTDKLSAPDEPFAQAGAVGTNIGPNPPVYQLGIIAAPEPLAAPPPSGGGTTAHGFVT